ncbi:MAG: endonuclease/exonuclease/phosphatase family protein [Myxococcota bacterium]
MILLGALGLALIIAAAGLGGALAWASGGSLRGPSRQALSAERLEIEALPRVRPEGELQVVCWNIGWACGEGSEMRPGTPRKTEAEIRGALTAIGETLATLDPDVVLLQEVDFGAARSFFVDQAALLAERARLPYCLRGLSWDVRYLPFPPGRHAGRLRSGGAILSRFPLTEAAIELLEKPRRGFLYRRFYLYRYLLEAKLQAFGDGVALMTCHLEAYDAQNRDQQAERLAAVLKDKPERRRVLAGDLNSVPPEAPQRHAYPDEPGTDHRREQVIPRLRAIPGLRPVFTPAALAADPAAHLSFPAKAPNRLLDHGFVGEGLEILEARVVREAGAPSDHLPIVFRLRLV